MQSNILESIWNQDRKAASSNEAIAACLITQQRKTQSTNKKGKLSNKKLFKPTHNLELNGLSIQFHSSDFLKITED